jgi:hypothetical protein
MFLILFLLNPLFFTLKAEEAVPLPRYRASEASPSSVTTDTLSQIDEKPKLHMDFLALKVSVKERYEYGVEWDKNKLEEFLGKPLQGRFIPSLEDPLKLDIESLMIKDRDKIVEYLSQYGTIQILYHERWTQSLGEQISREHSTVEPYIATFRNIKSKDGSGAVPYTQSTIRLGITLNLMIQGLQISGDEPCAEIIYEIDLKDSYKTADDIPALVNFISADSINIPFSHTLIQSHLFFKDDVRTEYIFLLTPRKLK